MTLRDEIAKALRRQAVEYYYKPSGISGAMQEYIDTGDASHFSHPSFDEDVPALVEVLTRVDREAEARTRAACEKELAELRAALQTITDARQADGEAIAHLQNKLQKAEAERDKAQLRYESEAALVRKMDADFSAARVGIMARQGELHEHLSLIVRYLEEETSQGDGISEENFDGYVAAKSVLARTAPDAPSWENAQFEVHQLLAKASEVPGLSATVDELRHERDRAVRLLHMLDNPEARHPDVAEFLDGLEQLPTQAPADAEAGRDEGANCHRCGHYELSFARAERELAHCPSCGKHTRWLAAERAEGREAMSEPRRRAEGGAA